MKVRWFVGGGCDSVVAELTGRFRRGEVEVMQFDDIPLALEWMTWPDRGGQADRDFAYIDFTEPLDGEAADFVSAVRAVFRLVPKGGWFETRSFDGDSA